AARPRRRPRPLGLDPGPIERGAAPRGHHWKTLHRSERSSVQVRPRFLSTKVTIEGRSRARSASGDRATKAHRDGITKAAGPALGAPAFTVQARPRSSAAPRTREARSRWRFEMWQATMPDGASFRS